MRRAGLWAIGLLVCGLAVGSWARFRDLGRWPVATDEWIFTKSVQNWAEGKGPSFTAGGTYARGLLPQGLALLSAEIGGHEEGPYRLPSALLGLLGALPLFWLVRRRSGAIAAAVAVLLFLLSSWQVEFSRFARMYAAMAALALFLFWALERGVVGGSRSWRRAVVPLLLAAVVVHEAHVVLAGLSLLFLLSPAVRRRLPRPGLLLVATGVAAAVCVAWTVAPWWPETAQFLDPRPGRGGPGTGISLPDFGGIRALAGSTALAAVWLLAALASLALGFRHVRGRTPLQKAAVLGVGALLAAGQLGLAFTLLVGLAFIHILPRGLQDRHVLRALLGPAAVGVGFLALLYLRTGDRAHLYAAVDYPSLHARVLRPWLAVTPIQGVVLLGTVLFGAARIALLGFHPRRDALALLTFAGFAAVGVSKPDLIETRYFHFLHGPALVLFVCETTRFLRRRLPMGRRPVLRRLAAPVGVLLFFVVSGDFRPRHLAAPGAEAHNFRTGPWRRFQNHWYSRWDFRQLAEEVRRRLGARDALYLVGSSLPVERYLGDHPFHVYLGRGHIFAAPDGQGGWTELWTAKPVVYKRDAFEAELARNRSAGRTSWIILPREGPTRERYAPSAASGWRLDPAFVERGGDYALFRLVAGG